jgi:Chs5-Arf1p-binding protein BUD7/BCH1
MRVEVKIPGGVKTHVIDERGTKSTNSRLFCLICRQEATEALWLETYMSSMIRSLLYADDESYRITGYRRLNPIPNKDAERRFVDAAERLFPLGTRIKSDFNGRLAIRFRTRSSGTKYRHKSFNERDNEIFLYHRKVGTRD